MRRVMLHEAAQRFMSIPFGCGSIKLWEDTVRVKQIKYQFMYVTLSHLDLILCFDSFLFL
ncbi:hypothetical protein SLEP1_g15051 [Rubroshorea leprosula]|uniref:Uncharacterized protein n=1 Tax=Rubroshorea leprosula TaxID=152421 RepID=A0AAV5IWX6_9ROSI|nr:hypothetical protein SLEP1_g15051 [Rubroshorea leprosula]